MPFSLVVLNPLDGKRMKHKHNDGSECHGAECKHRQHKKKKDKGRKTKKNPISGWGLLFAAVGGAAVGGVRYAADMTNMSRGKIGAAVGVVGTAIGTGVSMVSPHAGSGITGASLGIATFDGLAANLSEPAKSTSSGTGRVVDNGMGKVIANEVRQQLSAAMQNQGRSGSYYGNSAAPAARG